MRQKIFIIPSFIIYCFSIYAQDSIFSTKAYYSLPNEITVEIENLADQEIVILIDGDSYINLYKEAGAFKTEKLMNHPLESTDSLNILAKIPPNMIHVSKYKVKDTTLTKLYLAVRYSAYFTSPPANCNWKDYAEEMDILPYDKQRKQLNYKRFVEKKERLRGEYVFSNPEVKPEFPGGTSALYRFLDKETYKYLIPNEKSGVIRLRVVIEKDGSISHPYIIAGKDPYFQEAALEVVKRIPKWKPGINKGRPVRTFHIISVIFKLVISISPNYPLVQ